MLDPQHEAQAALSDQVITPIAGPSEIALRQLQDAEVPIVQLSQIQLVWRRFRRHKLAMIGAVILVLVLALVR